MNQLAMRINKHEVILTDTIPYELPIIVSNNGFYRIIKGIVHGSETYQNFIDAIILEHRDFTIPFRYNIIRDSDSVRTLSLLHPYSQLQIADFYDRYEQLIFEYAARSPFSIRYPIGRHFSKGDSSNAFGKTSTNNELEIDELQNSRIPNRETFFALYGHSRLYKFLRSQEHNRLERKYKYCLEVDVSKCFESIYTHTICWAVKGIPESKTTTRANSFGNRYDELMQELNYRETSGICIGPENSRIFAEIILARVDKDAKERLQSQKIILHSDYDVKRYVDNYYIFSGSMEILEIVQREVELVLNQFKLYFNTSKTVRHTRPFYTTKSLAIDKVNEAIDVLREKVTDEVELDGQTIVIAKTLRNHTSLFGFFTRHVKAACELAELGYESVSSYVVSSMKRTLIELTRGYDVSRESCSIRIDSENHFRVLFLLLDLGFFFFTVHPTVRSSIALTRALEVTIQHLKVHRLDGLEFLRESYFRWIDQLVSSSSFESIFERRDIVPIELLNILLCLRSFDEGASMLGTVTRKIESLKKELSYFEIVVRIYLYGKSSKFRAERTELLQLAKEKVTSDPDLSSNSELTHLLLDLVSCPFITKQWKIDVIKDIWPTLKRKHQNLQKLTNKSARELIEEFEQRHWFVSWDGVELLEMIENKDTSAVY